MKCKRRAFWRTISRNLLKINAFRTQIRSKMIWFLKLNKFVKIDQTVAKFFVDDQSSRLVHAKNRHKRNKIHEIIWSNMKKIDDVVKKCRSQRFYDMNFIFWSFSNTKRNNNEFFVVVNVFWQSKFLIWFFCICVKSKNCWQNVCLIY